MTHSKGPWKLEFDSDVVDVDFGPIRAWPYRIVDADGHDIIDFGDSAISEADARLMAAAPELLRALESLLFACRHGTGMSDWAKRKELAASAIIKAVEERQVIDGIDWNTQAAVEEAIGLQEQP